MAYGSQHRCPSTGTPGAATGPRIEGVKQPSKRTVGGGDGTNKHVEPLCTPVIAYLHWRGGLNSLVPPVTVAEKLAPSAGKVSTDIAVGPDRAARSEAAMAVASS